MGKKQNKKKRGLGAAKTAMKTERNTQRKLKNLREKLNIEDLIAEGQERYKDVTQAAEVKCQQPSPRSNMTISVHPEKEELLMFGGEFFNGDTTMMYNELYVYNLKSNTWSQIISPNPPPARCSHQAVMLPQCGGQLWIFGGEFSSPNQTQFHHYNDFWQFSLRTKTWKRIRAHGGPSARSGHKMVACNKYIISFGGFHDNSKEFRYFNDVHAFDVVNETWSKVKDTGFTKPDPRSACQMICTQDPTKVLVYGGFSKKDIDSGKTHTDMYVLNLVAPTSAEDEYKCSWSQLRSTGESVPANRCGFTMTSIPLNRAICFGGVNDQDDEDLMQTKFFNDLYTLDLEKGRWHSVSLRGKRTTGRRRRAVKHDGDEQMEAMDVMEEGLDSLVMEQHGDGDTGSPGDEASSSTPLPPPGAPQPPGPCCRMNAQLVVRNGILYLYGGTVEQGDKQITFRDLYKLNLHKLDEWQTIIKDDSENMEWEGSDSESSDSDESEDEEMNVAIEKDTAESSRVGPKETFAEYYGRCHEYWMDEAEKELEEKKLPVTGGRLKTLAKSLGRQFYTDNTEDY